MKKTVLLFICFSLIFMSCSPSPSGPGSNDTTNTSGGTSGEAPAPVPETPVTANNIPSVSTILEKIPISIEEYESYLNQSNNTNNSIFSTNFTVVPSPLSNEDEEGIKSGDINSKINSTADMFFTILKNDLKNLEIQSGTVFTVPSDFSVSAATESQIGVAINEYILDWGKLEVRYNDESKDVRIFWKFSILSGDGNPINVFIYVKGIFNNNNYESVEASFKTISGNFTGLGCEKYYKDGNSIIVSEYMLANNGNSDSVEKTLSIKNNGSQEIYKMNDDENWRTVAYKNTSGTGNYQYRIGGGTVQWPDNYIVCDSNNFVALKLDYNGSTASPQYHKLIPLHFISHPEKEITKVVTSTENNSNYISYYVNGSYFDSLSAQQFYVRENGQYLYKKYPCYEIYNTECNSFSLADGFSFTAENLASQGIAKLNELKTKSVTPAITNKFLPANSITQLQNELDTWVNALN